MNIDSPLLISFSGGRTSGLMTSILMDEARDREKAVIFANTGKERPETLDFVNECDRRWGLHVVWVEAVIDPEIGKGTRHRVVTYNTASRNGEPFEAMIKKYGIPNQAFPHCTRELKQNPIHSYVRRQLGWSNYQTAIGIRADEAHRAKEFYYPLVGMGITKAIVNDWWENQSFNLQLLEHEGNCDFCWKKSEKKLVRSVNENPTGLDWWESMESKYAADQAPHRQQKKAPSYFYRGNKSARDLRTIAADVLRQMALFER